MNKDEIIDEVYKRCKIHPNERFYDDSRINQIIRSTIKACEEKGMVK